MAIDQAQQVTAGWSGGKELAGKAGVVTALVVDGKNAPNAT